MARLTINLGLVAVTWSLLSCTAEAQTAAFDLTCTGSLRTLVPALVKDETKPYTTVYRIDLDAKKWCEADCHAQSDFVEVTPVDLVLEKRTVDTPREHEDTLNSISRETGDHFMHFESGIGPRRIALFWRGHCEKSAFTGFPHVDTKF
jgi:hypothetical protein